MPVPLWIKQGINEWTEAAGIHERRLLRAINKARRLHLERVSDRAVWSVVEASAAEMGRTSRRARSAALAPSSAGSAAETGTVQVPPWALLDPDVRAQSWNYPGITNRSK